jgi:hypothetical protein
MAYSRRLKMVSTSGGMRRILKNKGTVANYIRQAVESGSYRSEEELQAVYKERRDSADDLKTIMRRFRQDIVRGTAVHDYPIEYRIFATASAIRSQNTCQMVAQNAGGAESVRGKPSW